MVKIPFGKNADIVLRYFFNEVGGCRNTPSETANCKFELEKITGGALRGMSGYVGHSAEQGISWAIAQGGQGVYVETVPESIESMLVLKYA